MFPHRDSEFQELLRIVAEATGHSVGLVEKDYWVTHTLWALHTSGFDIWFKGGTSLSKGFQLIERFSEDLDLRIDPGTVGDLVLPDPWDARSKGAVRKRLAYFEALAPRLGIPDVEVRAPTIDGRARSASYEILYPGDHQAEVVASGMRPFVLLEVGRARVTPFVERDLSSFVHEFLRAQGRDEMLANLPRYVRCLHPLATLIDKLDAISARFRRGAEEATYARHYEDAACIIRGVDQAPELDTPPLDLANEMFACGDIRTLPNADDPAFAPKADRLNRLERACERISGMFWGERVPVAECCSIIRDWTRRNLR